MFGKGWFIKNERPEEIYLNPAEYYTKEEIEKYSKSSSMKKAQEKNIKRILELLEAVPPAKVLDIGCGVGFSTKFLEELGYKTIGIDVLSEMLKKAKEKKLKVKKVDAKDLSNFFKKEEFDYVVSTSALQWVKGSSNQEKIAKGIWYVLKPDGKVGIHFYPKSEEEMKLWGRIFKKAGFNGNFIVDNPENSRKRNIYLIASKQIN
ncbi:MAG: class I SAM-dependent methyltransferase [Candidatus Aenigmarchaeota archaeon]|nr:class I SAM-dependent methyltransferase [Candidatus Aenigmarchaeota archaeon]